MTPAALVPIPPSTLRRSCRVCGALPGQRCVTERATGYHYDRGGPLWICDPEARWPEAEIHTAP